MAELPLSQTVDASRSVHRWHASAIALITSTLVQGLVITVLIVTPLLVTRAMPEPVTQLTLPRFVPARVEPPVTGPHETRTDAPPPSGYPPRPLADILMPPPEIPEGIPESEAFFERWAHSDVVGLPPSLGGQPRPMEPRPAPEAERGPIRIDVGNIQPPRKLVHVDPVYPQLARKARVQGKVKLRAVIDVDGRVTDVVVVDSVPLLDRAAIDAVRQWRYQPTILNRRAVAVIMTVVVEFTLAR